LSIVNSPSGGIKLKIWGLDGCWYCCWLLVLFDRNSDKLTDSWKLISSKVTKKNQKMTKILNILKIREFEMKKFGWFMNNIYKPDVP